MSNDQEKTPQRRNMTTFFSPANMAMFIPVVIALASAYYTTSIKVIVAINDIVSVKESITVQNVNLQIIQSSLHNLSRRVGVVDTKSQQNYDDLRDIRQFQQELFKTVAVIDERCKSLLIQYSVVSQRLREVEIHDALNHK
jgi:hypothetical protein